MFIAMILFAICLMPFRENSFYSFNSYLIAQQENNEEIPIDGVWTIHDRLKDFSKLLNLAKTPYIGTCCVNINMKDNKAFIYFYTEKKSYEIKIIKIKVNEYKFINMNKKLGFVIWQRIDNRPNEVDLPSIRYIRMGIKNWDNVLQYDSHGQLGCLWNDATFTKCDANEVELCLKDAKKTDDYYRQEKALPVDLK